MSERDTDVKQKLTELGVSKIRAEGALELDAILQVWRRRVLKRELGVRAVSELGLPIEMPQLDALFAVWAPANEFGEGSRGETTVGTIATRLGIDPSRASRLASELIRKGLVERGVSQQDARRATLKVTPNGDRIVQAVRTFKFVALGHFLQGWSEAEIATFIPMLEQFAAWSDAPDDPSGRVACEINALRESLVDLASEREDRG